MNADLQTISEVVFGKILAGKLSSNSVIPDMLIEPYCDLLELYKDGSTRPEQLVEIYGVSAYDAISTAIQAEHKMNTIPMGDKVNWLGMLEASYNYYQLGEVLEKNARKAKRGELPDMAQLHEMIGKVENHDNIGFVKLSEVKPGSSIEIIPTGWKALDDHIGGLPATGLIVLGGAQGLGKTTAAMMIANCRAATQNKQIIVYSLEMVIPEISNRIRETVSSKLEPKPNEDLITLYDQPITAEEIIAKSSSIDNRGLIIVDYADYLVKGEMTESAMAHIYKTLALGSKSLGCPIILIAHLSRKDGIPRPEYLRWSGMAEATAWMILLLYDPQRSTGSDDDEKLPPRPFGSKSQAMYFVVPKIKGGFKLHLDDCPGAIAIPFRGDRGYHLDVSKWFHIGRD